MKKLQLLAISAVIVVNAASLPVMAGGINSYEAALIEEASGTFEYDGKLYAAKSQYLEQLKTKLSQDDVDLDAAQADELRDMMYANVAEGVKQGVLETVGDSPKSGVQKKEPEDEEKPLANDQSEPSRSTAGMVIRQTENERTIVETEDRMEAETEERTETETSLTEEETEKASRRAVEMSEADETSERETAKALESGLSVSEEANKTKKEFPLVGIAGIAAALVFMLAVAGFYRKNRKKRSGTFADGKYTLTEVHCHILPKVDDGARDMDMAMEMLGEEYRQGVRRIIATPHYHIGHYKKDAGELSLILEKVKEKAKEKYPDLELSLGSEIFYSAGAVEVLDAGKAPTLAGTRYVLVEFRVDDSWKHIQEALTTLLRARYMPVVAHVERYRNVIEHKEHLSELKEMGVLLQMNYSSVKRYKKWIKEGYIDLFGSDCHNLLDRSPKIRENILELAKICKESQLKKMLVDNPEKIWSKRNV